MAQVLYPACKQIWITEMRMQLIDKKESEQMDINHIWFSEPCFVVCSCLEYCMHQKTLWFSFHSVQIFIAQTLESFLISWRQRPDGDN